MLVPESYKNSRILGLTHCEAVEVEILNEVPYSAMKHFLHQLPDMLWFLFKGLVLFIGFQIVLAAMALAVAVVMLQMVVAPEFIEELQLTSTELLGDVVDLDI